MKGAALHCCRTAPGVKPCRAFPPCGSAKQANLLCTRSLRRLTIEVWHQTSGCKGSNFLREVQVGLHFAPSDEAGEALAAAVDPAGELAPDGGVFGVCLYLAKQGGTGEIAGADIIGEGEQGVELMLVDGEAVWPQPMVQTPAGHL